MSDNDSRPDPIDKAYAQAETILSDDDARAARRARVLAAVAREPATQPAPSSVSARPPYLRRGGWLAAACVAGLSVFLATQIYRPPPRQSPKAPAAPTSTDAAPPAPAPAPSKAMEVPASSTRGATPVQSAPRSVVAPAAAPTPPPSIEPHRPALPAAPVAAPSPPPAPEVVAAESAAPAPAADNERRDSRSAAAKAQDLARSSAPSSPVGAAQPASRLSRPGASDELQPDQGASLRAAAAGGRTAEVKALLDQGAPVDAPDVDGNSALMKSIQANHPAVAAILRRHGASLDRKNHAGQSARDMATAKGEAALNRAIGLDR